MNNTPDKQLSHIIDINLDGLNIRDDFLRDCLLGKEYLLIDGAMGTQLQAKNLLKDDHLPELLNLTNPDDISEIHKRYIEAGAHVITTNTFGANRLKLQESASVEEIYAAAAKCAREAGARYIAGDIGPLGCLIEPLGTLDFESACELFAEQVKAVEDSGCDIVLIETLGNLKEAKAALLAAKENCNLPTFITMTFEEDKRTFFGTTPLIAAETLSSLGANAVGINCSLGPDQLVDQAAEMAKRARCPIMVQPNAGLPREEAGQTVYDVDADEFAKSMEMILESGANIVGGCCGTTPAYTAALAKKIEGKKPVLRTYEEATVISSAQTSVVLPSMTHKIATIGERINPTGKPKLKNALVERDFNFLVAEAISQQQFGADMLDVNVGLPQIDESEVLSLAVAKISEATPLPLVIDSSDEFAVEKSVRSYAGKPLINSVNGKEESMKVVLPLAKHYGCAVIGLTLDENGIPKDALGRLDIAKRIVDRALQIGLTRSDVVIDCLAMACSTNQDETKEILKAITLIKDKLGTKTSLGVSNISFGLPQRSLINSTFLAAAFGCGLDIAIINPASSSYNDTINAFKVLNGQDKSATEFIKIYGALQNKSDDRPKSPSQSSKEPAEIAKTNRSSDEDYKIEIPDSMVQSKDTILEVVDLILTGQKDAVSGATEELLNNNEPLKIINNVFIPALDIVGEKYEDGEFFLPQLMTSAQAAKAGFDVIRRTSAKSDSDTSNARKIILATVKGDIHDIGKNIVKMVLENYDFDVIDLGKDVPPQEILKAAQAENVTLVGLSALMTTTVPAMQETIELLHSELAGCKVIVGGAVLNEEYAKKINADFYAKDATATAKIAQEHFRTLVR